jgi:hypothetical protein
MWGCGQAKSDWDHARKAGDFFVTSVRAVHGMVLDMLSSAPNSICSVPSVDTRKRISCYHLLIMAAIVNDDALVDSADAPIDVDILEIKLTAFDCSCVTYS